MVFWVIVPVLSVAITLAMPRVSVACKFLIMAFFLAILCAPIAKTITKTAGNPSGIAETKAATAKRRASSQPRKSARINSSKKSKVTAPKAMPAICLARNSVFFLKWVLGVVIFSRLWAISPKAVLEPMAETIAFACPEVTKVPSQTMFFWSPKEVFSGSSFKSLSIGSDSPVKAASMVLKFFNSINLASAGILSPSSNKIISPGTSSLAGIFINSPVLITLAKGTTIFFRALIAFSAFVSCIKPMPALNKRTAKII